MIARTTEYGGLYGLGRSTPYSVVVSSKVKPLPPTTPAQKKRNNSRETRPDFRFYLGVPTILLQTIKYTE